MKFLMKVGGFLPSYKRSFMDVGSVSPASSITVLSCTFLRLIVFTVGLLGLRENAP